MRIGSRTGLTGNTAAFLPVPTALAHMLILAVFGIEAGVVPDWAPAG